MDLRNESREWPASHGNQELIDMGLNGFGLELFVESYWGTLQALIESGLNPKDLPTPMVITYRGMTISLDPTPGLAARDGETQE